MRYYHYCKPFGDHLIRGYGMSHGIVISTFIGVLYCIIFLLYRVISHIEGYYLNYLLGYYYVSYAIVISHLFPNYIILYCILYIKYCVLYQTIANYMTLYHGLSWIGILWGIMQYSD